MDKTDYLTEDEIENLDWFRMEFESYNDFKVRFKIDPSIIACHGDEYRPIAISVTDENMDLELILLIDKKGNYVYNVYEDIYETISNPEELWKYFYFEACRKC